MFQKEEEDCAADLLVSNGEPGVFERQAAVVVKRTRTSTQGWSKDVQSGSNWSS